MGIIIHEKDHGYSKIARTNEYNYPHLIRIHNMIHFYHNYSSNYEKQDNKIL